MGVLSIRTGQGGKGWRSICLCFKTIPQFKGGRAPGLYMMRIRGGPCFRPTRLALAGPGSGFGSGAGSTMEISRLRACIDLHILDHIMNFIGQVAGPRRSCPTRFHLLLVFLFSNSLSPGFAIERRQDCRHCSNSPFSARPQVLLTINMTREIVRSFDGELSGILQP